MWANSLKDAFLTHTQRERENTVDNGFLGRSVRFWDVLAGLWEFSNGMQAFYFGISSFVSIQAISTILCPSLNDKPVVSVSRKISFIFGYNKR